MATEEVRDAYAKGVTAGEIAARLEGHDEHLAAINGSMGRVADELHELTLAVQGLRDGAIARDATVITTAKALKDAGDVRREQSQQRWSPVTKGVAVIGGVVATIGTAVGVWLSIRPH
jgi:hypothetical protein